MEGLSFTKNYITNIKVKKINLKNKEFVIRYWRKDLQELENSIKKIGILNPVIVKERGGNYIVVIGYSRVKVAKKLKMKKIPGIITTLPDKDCFLLSFFETLSSHTLTSLEKAIVLQKLTKYLKKKEVVKKFLPLMKLHPTERVIIDHLRVLKLGSSIKQGIYRGEISMYNALKLSNWKKEESRRIFNIIKELKLSESNQKEIITYIKEISIREGIEISSILTEIEKIISSSTKERAIKISLIRSYLHKRRFPLLSKYETQFKKITTSLPPGVKLKHSPYFEDPQFTVEMNIKDKENFLSILQKLTTLVKEGNLDKLFTFF
jgi:ParB family chromosome partitioning protein